MSADTSVRSLLAELLRLTEGGGEGLLYGNCAKAIAEIDAVLPHPDNKQVSLLLAPTGNLQELSMEYGWGERFCQIAADIERIMGLS